MRPLRTKTSERGFGRNPLVVMAGIVAITGGIATAADESTYWRLVDVPEPEGVAHEVGAVLPLGGLELSRTTIFRDLLHLLPLCLLHFQHPPL